ncbi:hypothetical protein, partial [Lysinibacillus sp. NPDC056232]|uniref:hypothetical protein n=1 Tax=Lysinibacillus sp. NPDC056232 TaxID=3345756 RepID=UPI0035DEE062
VYSFGKIFKVLKRISLAFSILSLLTFPFLNIKFINSDILATAISIIAIGLTIINLSLNHKKLQYETFERMIKGMEESSELTNKALEQAESAQSMVIRLLDNAEDKKTK